MGFLSIVLHIIAGAVLIVLGLFMVFIDGEFTPKFLPVILAVLTMAVFGESSSDFFGLKSMEILVFPIMIMWVLQMILDSERFFGAIIGVLFIIAGLLAIGVIGAGAAEAIGQFLAGSGSFILFIVTAPMLGFLILFL